MPASPPTIDVDTLLSPISSGHPAGESLQYEGTYDQIREARRADDGLAQGDWQHDVKTADWSAAIDLASQALLRTKDLQIAAWLTEALIKRHGFPGLREGLRIIRGLLDAYWDGLYPAADDGDLDARANSLAFLDKAASTSLRQIPLTRAPELGGEELCWLEYDESVKLAALALKDTGAAATAIEQGGVSAEKFSNRVDATPISFYQIVFADLAEAFTEFVRLDETADARFGREAPSLAGLKAAIRDCQAVVESILKRRGAYPAPPADGAGSGASLDSGDAAGDDGADGSSAASASTGAGLTLEPRDRADALRRLRAVAGFFRKTEPHSPVSYLVDRAARWGEMPLETWLQDVIKSDDVLRFVRETLGLIRREEDS